MRLVKSYVDEICNYIQGKDVLDIGCCSSTSKNLLKRHFQYKKAAKSIIGVDYNKKLIAEAKSRFNYVVHYCDFTSKKNVRNIIQQFGKFSTIVCTDVIEHIGNMTNFLDNINLIMTSDGVLHLTTPNARSPRWFYLTYKKQFKINLDHVCWLDITTLKSLLKRSQFEIVEEMYHAQENKVVNVLKLEEYPWMARRLYVTVKKVI